MKGRPHPRSASQPRGLNHLPRALDRLREAANLQLGQGLVRPERLVVALVPRQKQFCADVLDFDVISCSKDRESCIARSGFARFSCTSGASRVLEVRFRTLKSEVEAFPGGTRARPCSGRWPRHTPCSGRHQGP